MLSSISDESFVRVRNSKQEAIAMKPRIPRHLTLGHLHSAGHITIRSAVVVALALLSLECCAWSQDTRGWCDWRGPGRAAYSPDVPSSLPSKLTPLWTRPLTGSGLAGLSAADDRVVLTDKTADAKSDVFRCLDAGNGREVWNLTYPAPEKMDYGNAPRATPVIHNGLVYLLGAFGQLHCVRLDNGEVIWRKDFGATVPIWGFCSSPLVVDGKLIINPGGKNTSIVALDLVTGKTVWETPGDKAAYGALILATLGGRRQIVGYDQTSVGGWLPESGERMWRLVPEEEGEYNVPTPVVVGGRLFLATEMNGARLHGFDSQGRIIPEPIATNDDFFPDMISPVAAGELVLGGSGSLMCLDINRGLDLAWESWDEHYAEYFTAIAGDARILITSIDGWLHLLEKNGRKHHVISRIDMFPGLPEKRRTTWSHPALVGNLYFIRNQAAAYCFRFDLPPESRDNKLRKHEALEPRETLPSAVPAGWALKKRTADYRPVSSGAAAA